MQQLPDVVRDRGSKYAVSGGVAASREDADAFLAELKRDKKFAKATHNTWAVILSDGTPLKGDDGESGAGNVILRMLERGWRDRPDTGGDALVRRQAPGRRPVPARADLRAGVAGSVRLMQVKDGGCRAV